MVTSIKQTTEELMKNTITLTPTQQRSIHLALIQILEIDKDLYLDAVSVSRTESNSDPKTVETYFNEQVNKTILGTKLVMMFSEFDLSLEPVVFELTNKDLEHLNYVLTVWFDICNDQIIDFVKSSAKNVNGKNHKEYLDMLLYVVDSWMKVQSKLGEINESDTQQEHLLLG